MKLRINKTCYTAFAILWSRKIAKVGAVVIIEGAESFKGFFLQARSLETEEWLGRWEQAPNTTVHPECAAITHADPREKARATLVWRAPSSVGRVYFTGTVLKNYGTFWSGLVAEAPVDNQLQPQQLFA